jgi:hypothetical protein
MDKMKRVILLIVCSIALAGCLQDMTKASPVEILQNAKSGGSEFDTDDYTTLPPLHAELDRGLLGSFDRLEFMLAVKKNKTDGKLKKGLLVKVKYTEPNWRFYESANFKGGEQADFSAVSRKVLNCVAYKTQNTRCDYSEIMSITLTDSFIENNKGGFSVRLNSQSPANNVITIPENYMAAFLELLKQ